MGIVGRTRLFIRKSLDAMWPPAASTAVRARPRDTRNRRGSSNVAVSVSVGALLAHVNNDEEAIGESRLDRIGWVSVCMCVCAAVRRSSLGDNLIRVWVDVMAKQGEHDPGGVLPG
jgi:hypothetical protein